MLAWRQDVQDSADQHSYKLTVLITLFDIFNRHSSGYKTKQESPSIEHRGTKKNKKRKASRTCYCIHMSQHVWDINLNIHCPHAVRVSLRQKLNKSNMSFNLHSSVMSNRRSWTWRSSCHHADILLWKVHVLCNTFSFSCPCFFLVHFLITLFKWHSIKISKTARQFISTYKKETKLEC